MLTEIKDYTEDDYVDVRTLPLKPPQPLVPAEKPQRRPWHPVMWDSTPATVSSQDDDDEISIMVYEILHGACWRSASPASSLFKACNSERCDGRNIKNLEPNFLLDHQGPQKEYPHKQRIRNLRRLIADGKIKPTSETLIFFLCNKFAVSDERQKKIHL